MTIRAKNKKSLILFCMFNFLFIPKSYAGFDQDLFNVGMLGGIIAGAVKDPGAAAELYAKEALKTGVDILIYEGLKPTQPSQEIYPPPTIDELQNIPDYKGDPEKSVMPVNIRLDAMKEAALSYGARGGLVARGHEIAQETRMRAKSLDKVYDFRQLLIAGPSGFMIEPPIISESLKDLLIEGDGQKAAVADAIYRINENVKIVSAPRDWRQYLERSWGKVDPPPEVLRPQGKEERVIWNTYVEKGWKEGYAQADEVFAQDLNRLNADFTGMVRYRQLLAQGMVSQPFAQQIDRGVTAEDKNNIMRVGDRAVVITGVPQLITESQRWQPANR